MGICWEFRVSCWESAGKFGRFSVFEVGIHGDLVGFKMDFHWEFYFMGVGFKLESGIHSPQLLLRYLELELGCWTVIKIV